MERNPENSDQQDGQLQRLAGRMRDTGVAPDRDLWPDIDAAISREENESGRRGPRRSGRSWVRMTAMAAALVLMLAAGWVGIGSITGDGGLPDVADESETDTGGLAVIDRALDELNLALADDPENRSLSQLVLMVHKTRGNLMRRNPDSLLRDK